MSKATFTNPLLSARFQVCGTDMTFPKVRRFVPPEERFFEYDESDYSWLEFFGYGHREETGENPAYQFRKIQFRDASFVLQFGRGNIQ